LILIDLRDRFNNQGTGRCEVLSCMMMGPIRKISALLQARLLQAAACHPG